MTGRPLTAREVPLPPGVAAVATVPALLSVATVAQLLDCSPRTVRRRITARELPAVVDHGRIMVRGDELRAYVDRLERVGAGEARRRRCPPGTVARLHFPARVTYLDASIKTAPRRANARGHGPGGRSP